MSQESNADTPVTPPGGPPPTPGGPTHPPGGPYPFPGGPYLPPAGPYPYPGGPYPYPGGQFVPPGGQYGPPGVPYPYYPPYPLLGGQMPPVQPPAPPARQGVGLGQFFITAVLVVLAFTAGWLGNSAVNGGASTPTSARPYAPTIWAAWNDINQNYWDPSAVNNKQMTAAMITAMVNSLGDTGHSRYQSAADAQQLNQQLNNGSFVGIGVYLQTVQTSKGSANIIEATIPDSPASKSGLLPGDQIDLVNGTDVSTASIDALGPLIKGPAGSDVTITVLRPSDGKLHSFTMQRASVTAPLVNSVYLAQDHIAYVAIPGVESGTGVELTKQLQTLQTEGATSIILDLRGDGGGYVNEAVNIASDFIPANSVVFYEKDRSGTLTPHTAAPDGLHLTLPMVVLVDGGTASAAEIITEAIHVNRPSVQIIGQQTYGTDTELVQFDLPDGSSLLLGVAQWLAPDKTHLTPGKGLTPNVTVALPTNSFPENPLVLQELNLTETDVLNCQGITVDSQLIAAITTLDPTRISTCAPKS